MSHHDDPGWPSTGAIVLALVVPFVGPLLLRRAGRSSPLMALRILYIHLFSTPLYLLRSKSPSPSRSSR